jgi:hypothetical protein
MESDIKAPRDVAGTDLRVRLERLPQARAIDFLDRRMVVELADGRSVHVPLAWLPWLERASDEQRRGFELVGEGIGIHWPGLDEDLFVLDLLVPAAPRPSAME